MARSKWSFKFFLVPKQWKVTNIGTKFFKNSSFWLRKSLKQKSCWGNPPQTFCLLIPWGLTYTFWVFYVWSHDGLWELPCADTGMSGPGQSRRGNWWVFRRPTLLGGPRIHKNLNPPGAVTSGTPGFGLSCKKGLLIVGEPVTHPHSCRFLEEYSNHQIRNNYYRSIFFLLYWGRRQLLS